MRRAQRRSCIKCEWADTYNHVASSGRRYIANPPDASIRVHQHLDIGQGEIDWETFFKTLGEV